jgi:hypothetical protein
MTDEEEDYEFLIFDENYDYNPDAYKYGDINGKRIRVSVDDWMDIWKWRICKSKDSYWLKLTPYLHTTTKGYKSYYISINGGHCIMSRLIFKLYNKNWDITDISDTNFIDHKNQNSLDNRIENLRVLTHQYNQWNRNARGTTQLASGKWRAVIKYNGKRKTKEPFDTEPEAHEYYLLLKAELHIIPE